MSAEVRFPKLFHYEDTFRGFAIDSLFTLIKHPYVRDFVEAEQGRGHTRTKYEYTLFIDLWLLKLKLRWRGRWCNDAR